MKQIRVLVVDDSAVVRKVMSDIFDTVADIELMGAAQDPIFAMTRMQKEWPDVIVLDVEMPKMDGLTFLRKIMAERPTPVVMCSTLTDKGSSTTLQAISYGAVEIIAKPKANLKHGLEDSSRLLINAVRAAAKANLKVVTRTAVQPKPVAPRPTARAVPARRPGPFALGRERVVAIGTSTGGTQALELILPALDASAPPMVVVQHMPEKFTRAFADRLNGLCAVEVKEAEDNEPISSGRVLIAPGGRHMLVKRNGRGSYVNVKDGPLVSRHRPSVDVLFRSVAQSAGKNALGIIMTGMGDDGANGLKEMHDAGAATLAQNEATCVIYGMPAVAVERGGVDRQVPLDAIPSEIMAFGHG